MDEIIIPADKKYRARMLRFLIFGLAAGGIAASLGLPAIMKNVDQGVDKVLVVYHALHALLMILFLLLIPFALYLMGVGKLTIAAKRFPPPGIRVIRDTRLISGAKAVLRGRAMIFSSVVMILLALWGIVQVHRLSRMLMV